MTTVNKAMVVLQVNASTFTPQNANALKILAFGGSTWEAGRRESDSSSSAGKFAEGLSNGMD